MYMGISTKNYIIIGWKLDTERVRHYRIESNIETCCSNQNYMCGCDHYDPNVPENFTLLCTSPYFDCHCQDKVIYLTHQPSSTQYNFDEMNKIINNKEIFEKAREFAKRLGTDCEPMIIPVTHVY